jgi:hypothetical protein
MADPATTPSGAASVELRPKSSPLGAFVAVVCLTLFWNGLVSVFVWHGIAAARTGDHDGFILLFLLPFVLIGLGLIYAVARQFLVLFNPRLHMTLTPGELTLGRSAYLQWRLGSGGKGVRRVKITLQGREERDTWSGKNHRTWTETFLTLPVADSAESAEIEAGGSASFVPPARNQPSLREQDHRIIWVIHAHCDIAGWPDSDDDYEVVVRAGTSG